MRWALDRDSRWRCESARCQAGQDIEAVRVEHPDDQIRPAVGVEIAGPDVTNHTRERVLNGCREPAVAVAEQHERIPQSFERDIESAVEVQIDENAFDRAIAG